MKQLKSAITLLTMYNSINSEANRFSKAIAVLKKACKPKWKQEKKWQRKGGDVRYTPIDGTSKEYATNTGNRWNFDSDGVYEKVPTPRKKRLANLKEHQDSGGKVEGKNKKRPAPYNQWHIETWWFNNTVMSYRKKDKF